MSCEQAPPGIPGWYWEVFRPVEVPVRDVELTPEREQVLNTYPAGLPLRPLPRPGDGELERVFREYADRAGLLEAKRVLHQFGGDRKLSELDDEARTWMLHWLQQLAVDDLL